MRYLTLVILLGLTTNSFGANVTDNAKGSDGQILVNTGNSSGHQGEWVDPTSVPGLQGPQGIQGEQGEKGDKGDTGEIGPQGIQGEKGDQGNPGINGQDGAIGPQGNNGADGINGTNGKDGINGVNGKDGAKGQDGSKGEKGDKGDQGKGLKDGQEFQIEARMFDTKRFTGSIYTIHDFSNDINTVGCKLTVKFGTSYEERKIAELEKKLNSLLEN